jgi:hypothetical protein
LTGPKTKKAAPKALFSTIKLTPERRMHDAE